LPRGPPARLPATRASFRQVVEIRAPRTACQPRIGKQVCVGEAEKECPVPERQSQLGGGRCGRHVTGCGVCVCLWGQWG